jgi:Holliday junction DNA helicase RuvB
MLTKELKVIRQVQSTGNRLYYQSNGIVSEDWVQLQYNQKINPKLTADEVEAETSTLETLVNDEIEKSNMEKLSSDSVEIPKKISIEQFRNIYGYDDVKQLLIDSLNALYPVHLCISGPPGTSKTVFLNTLKKVLGSSAHFIDAVIASGTGLIQYIFDQHGPIKYLLIDELDKMERGEQAYLLNLMETGILKETKFNRSREKNMQDCYVFATSNNDSRILEPLMTRFINIRIPTYDRDQFCKISSRLLIHTFQYRKEIAEYAAMQVWNNTNPPLIRELMRMGKLQYDTKEEIDAYISLLKKYELVGRNNR